MILELEYHPPDGTEDTDWESQNLPAPVPLSGEPIEQPTQPLIFDPADNDGANSVISRMTNEERRQSHVNLEMMNFNPRASKTPSMVSIASHLNDSGSQGRNG